MRSILQDLPFPFRERTLTEDSFPSLVHTALVWYPGAQVGRWGGEEFFVMLPGIEEEKALVYADHLRHIVDHHIFPTIGHLTISQGVITVRNCADHKIAYKDVDDALYAAKDSGRNRVVQAQSL